MANLYTKTGDKGQTGLVGGSRVSKDNARVCAYGTVDEVNSMLGLAYSLTDNDYIRESLHQIQGKLFVLGAELASDREGLEKLRGRILTQEDVTFLETVVDHCTETTGKQTEFVVPGVNRPSAALHVARTIVRRAERCMITAKQTEDIRQLLFTYVNRLSDTIYALARLEETLHDQEQLREKVMNMVKNKLNCNDGQKKTLTLDMIKELAQIAERKAADIKVPIVFSAVDSGGNLILCHRMDNSLLGSIDISINKAYTANALKTPTHQLADQTGPGGALHGIQNTNQGRIVIFGGGYPLIENNHVLGAIGISGGTVEEDMIIGETVINEFRGGR